MAEIPSTSDSQTQRNRRFFGDLAQAYGGAILFSFPLLMTMEVWYLGFYMDGYRLALFTFLAILLLIGLSYFDGGFEDTITAKDDVRETLIAYSVGFSASAVMLFLFGVINTGMTPAEIIGKISLQAITGSLGAMFAQSLLSGDQTNEGSEIRKRSATYSGQLFLTAVGAIFLSMSVAPTEEMVLISYQMTDWHTVALAIVTLTLMYAFVYAAQHLRKRKLHSPDESPLSVFLRFTVVGYAIVLLISFYILWTFHSIDGMALTEQLKATIVLGFPGAIGASASRLIL